MIEIVKRKIKRARSEAVYFQKAAREQTLGYILAAFGLVAGLAWNDAVRTLIETIFPIKENTVAAKFLYALLMTLILVAISLYLARILGQNREE